MTSILYDGYAITVLKYLQDFECGTDQSLFSEAEEGEIYGWLKAETMDVPDGWFAPDPWRYRCLKKVNRLRR